MSVDSDRKLLNDLGIEVGDIIKLNLNENGYYVTSRAASGRLCFMNCDAYYTVKDFIYFRKPKKENIIFLRKNSYKDRGMLEWAYSQIKKYEKQGE